MKESESESELIQYLKEKEERDSKKQKRKDEVKLGIACAGIILSPLLLPKGVGEW